MGKITIKNKDAVGMTIGGKQVNSITIGGKLLSFGGNEASYWNLLNQVIFYYSTSWWITTD